MNMLAALKFATEFMFHDETVDKVLFPVDLNNRITLADRTGAKFSNHELERIAMSFPSSIVFWTPFPAMSRLLAGFDSALHVRYRISSPCLYQSLAKWDEALNQVRGEKA